MATERDWRSLRKWVTSYNTFDRYRDTVPVSTT